MPRECNCELNSAYPKMANLPDICVVLSLVLLDQGYPRNINHMHPKGTSFGAPAVKFWARVPDPSGLQREISTKFPYFWMGTE